MPHSNSSHILPKIFSFKNVVVPFIWIIFFGVNFWLKAFVIQEVSCTSDDQKCSEPVTAELSKLKKHFLFDSSVVTTTDKIMRFEPNIKTLDISKRFPGTLVVTLHKQQAAFVLHCSNKLLSFSQEGDLLSQNSAETQESLLHLFGSQQLCDTLDQTHHIDRQTTQNLISFLKRIDQLHQKGEVVWQDANTLVLTTPDKQRVVFSVEKLIYQAEVFAFILSQPNSTQFATLDLRFRKPVGTTHTIQEH